MTGAGKRSEKKSKQKYENASAIKDEEAKVKYENVPPTPPSPNSSPSG